VLVSGLNGVFGFASDALYSYDCKEGCFRATVVRASRYATDVHAGPDFDLWRPAVDAGELAFRFLLAPGGDRLPVLARELEAPPTVLPVPAKPGLWARSGSLASLAPETLQLLALKPAENGNGWILRVQETAGVATEPQLHWLGAPIPPEAIAPYQIATWRLTPDGAGWAVQRTTIVEG
jgi:alpha-mannosidase